MSLFSPSLISKNCIYPPENQFFINVKTSPPQKNLNNRYDVFVLIKKNILKVFLVLAALDLLLFVTKHKVITCLAVFLFERETYSSKVLNSVIECLTSSNIIIYA